MVARTTPGNPNLQGFPQISVPFSMPAQVPITAISGGGAPGGSLAGRSGAQGHQITPTWYYLLLSLFNRTGGTQGNGVLFSGLMAPYAGDSVPDGWLLCDGSAISRTTYAALFSAISTKWGVGDGSSTFNLPDLRARTILGADGSHSFGSTGGAETVTLTTAQLPAHNHPVTDPGHVHTALVASSTNTAGAAAGTAVAGNTGSATTGITIGNTGSGDPVRVISPYAAANWIIRT